MTTAVHPGILLEERLVERGISEAQLADATRISRALISAILHQNRRITSGTALLLATFFNEDPRFWVDAQADHDLAVAAVTLKDRVAQVRPLAAVAA